MVYVALWLSIDFDPTVQGKTLKWLELTQNSSVPQSASHQIHALYTDFDILDKH